jgi:2-polyprenyl-6-methoxyphenol hydroxylase-like FAD-dependent oxidoreductase
LDQSGPEIGGAVTASLSDGTTISADLVVGADGPHSAVRRLAFGPEEEFVKPLAGDSAIR